MFLINKSQVPLIVCAKGGGGSSGAVSFPAYMETLHDAWLTKMDLEITAALASNPFTGAAPFDPITVLGAITTELAAFQSVVDGYLTGAGQPGAVGVTDAYALLTTVIASVVFAASNYDETLEVSHYDNALNTSVYSAALNTSVYNATLNVSNFDAALNTSEYDETLFDSSVFGGTFITDDATAFSNYMADEVTNRVLPGFKAGMLNLGAVNTSAFVIGEAIINAFKTRDVAKYTAEMKLKLNMLRNEMVIKRNDQNLQRDDFNIKRNEQHLLRDKLNIGRNDQNLILDGNNLKRNDQNLLRDEQNLKRQEINLERDKISNQVNVLNLQRDSIALQKHEIDTHRLQLRATGVENFLRFVTALIQFKQSSVHYTTEANRIKIVALSEKAIKEVEYDEKFATWDFESLEHGGNLLAAISGAPSTKTEMKGQSSLGAAISGAAAGAMMGNMVMPGVGAAVGGVLGGIGGLLAG